MRHSGKSGCTMPPEDPKIKHFIVFDLSEATLEASLGGIIARPSDRNPRGTQGAKKQKNFPPPTKKQQPVAAAVTKQSHKVFLVIHAHWELEM